MDKKRGCLWFVMLGVIAILLFHIQIVCAAPRNRAPASLIPKELKGTDIRNDYMTTGTKQVGFIQTVVGHVIVANGDLTRAYYAASGDRLYEKDVIFTLKDSRCRFKVSGEDVVTMAQNTHLGIKTFNEDARTKTKQSLFSMAKGKAMFYAMRLFRHRNASMQVETPTAVSGVRGTKWGVEVVEMEGGKETASLPPPIQVADTSDLGFRQLASFWNTRRPGGQSSVQFITTVLCFSGTVFTGSTAPPPPGAPPPPIITLSQGQMTTVGSGAPPAPPTLTPLSLVNSFIADTFVPGGGTPPPPPPPPPGGAPPPPPPPPDTSGVVQQQNLSSGASRPTSHVGYGTGLLTGYYVNITTYNVEEYFPNNDRANFDSGPVGSATDPKITITGLPTSAPMLTALSANTNIGGGTSWVDLSGVNHAISTTEMGYNPYMEWGYWTQPTVMTYTSGPDVYQYSFNNRGYYIWGDVTTDAQLGALKTAGVVGNYAGSAYGTYWTPSGGVNMTGTFSTTVSFAQETPVTNFSMSISGGGKSASINGGSGCFDGTTSHFSINNGTWMLNGSTPDTTQASGSVYGSTGQAVGGIFHMTKGTNPSKEAVQGIFQGKR